MKKPPGVILAGGLATRMGGGDKGLLTLGGTTLLQHVIDRLTPQVGEIALNANGDGARFADFGLPVLPDSIGGFVGPLGGILAALDWAAALGEDHVVTVAADTPFFPRQLVEYLQEAAAGDGANIVLAGNRGDGGKLYRHPTFGLWAVDLRDDLRTAIEDGVRKVVIWSDGHANSVAEFDGATTDPFFNVNTPEDLVAAEAILLGEKP